jgi:hypothetical protein
MVTTVAIPKGHADSKDFGKPTDIRLEQYGQGNAEVDEVLEARRIARSRVMMDQVAEFVNDPDQKELINWGRGPGDLHRALNPSPKELEAKIKAGDGTAGIFTVIRPANIDLYRSLLPEPLTMPKEPVVGVTLLDMNPLGSSLNRFQEGRVTIKAMCPDGVESWFVISIPVADLLMCYMGVVWGWPKYVADEMSLTRDRAEVIYEGEVRLSLDFAPGPVDNEVALKDLGRVEAGNTVSFHWRQGGACLVRQVGRGGTSPTVLDWQAGTVKVYMRPQDPWAGLIPENSNTPGFYSKFIGGVGGNLVWQKVATIGG